jgi:hypothetical protein
LFHALKILRLVLVSYKQQATAKVFAYKGFFFYSSTDLITIFDIYLLQNQWITHGTMTEKNSRLFYCRLILSTSPPPPPLPASEYRRSCTDYKTESRKTKREGRGRTVALSQKTAAEKAWPLPIYFLYRSRIHERTISWRILVILLRVLRLDVSVQQCLHNKPLSNHYLPFVEVTVHSKEGNSKRLLSQLRPRIRP